MNKKKKKVNSKKEEPKQIAIDLSNVFPFIVKMIAKHDRDLDRLQKTVDAIGLLLANQTEKKNA